jgi:glycosyltransferase involved in cell wall biosynthesis
MSAPRVTVIIPCYNGERYIAEAIASIRRQQCPGTEILVIDDGSSDGSARVVAAEIADTDADTDARGAIRYVYQDNRGLPGARNAGLAHARGRLISFLDVDDVYCDGKIALQSDLLERNPELDMVLGRMQKTRLTRDQNGRSLFTPFEPPAPALSMACATIRREVFERVGNFDESRAYCDDWDWFMRAREAGVNIHMHEEVVVEYRRHETNMTNQVGVGNHHTLQMLKNSLERRRRQHGEAHSLPGLLKKDD